MRRRPLLRRSNRWSSCEVPAGARQGDWELRLGLADGGEAAADWRLLYCLASYVGPAGKGSAPKPIDRMPDSAHALGPVSYTARRASLSPDKLTDKIGRQDLDDVYAGQYGRKGEFVEEFPAGSRS